MNSNFLKVFVLALVSFSGSAFASSEMGEQCFDRSPVRTASFAYGRFTVFALRSDVSDEGVTDLNAALEKNAFVQTLNTFESKTTGRVVYDIEVTGLKKKKSGQAVFLSKEREADVLEYLEALKLQYPSATFLCSSIYYPKPAGGVGNR